MLAVKLKKRNVMIQISDRMQIKRIVFSRCDSFKDTVCASGSWGFLGFFFDSYWD